MPVIEGVLAKLIHAIGGGIGAAVAMAILKPRSLGEAFARGFVGVFTATVGVSPAMHWLPVAHDVDNMVLVAYGIGFAAWFLLGAALLTLESWRKGGLRAVVNDLLRLKRGAGPDTE